jgi:N-acetylglucosamine malate deacetylase 1
MSKVLVISAHLDDEVLGVGGTMARHADAGDEVHVLNVCDRSERHRFDADMVTMLRRQAQRMAKIVGVAQIHHGKLADEYLDISLADVIRPIEQVVEAVQPSTIYTHHKGDVNQDHRAIFEATLVATRSFTYPFIQQVFSFEVLSSTEQAPASLPGWQFAPNYFVDINDTLKRKIRGMACYKSEFNGFPFPRSEKGIRTLAHYRGMQCGKEAAEAFEVIKIIR